jgi:hypothetical protein
MTLYYLFEANVESLIAIKKFSKIFTYGVINR